MPISLPLPTGVKCKVLYDGPRNSDWLEARRISGVGASESPGVLGFSRFSTAYSVYADKIEGDRRDPGEAAHWGQLLEPVILNEFLCESKREGWDERRTLQSTEHDFMIASPDGWQTNGDGGLGTIQVKASMVNWEDDGVPRDVWCQMQHEFYVTGVRWGTAVALLNGNRMRWLDVSRDNDFIDNALVPTVDDFWTHVRALDPLPSAFLDGRKETKKALERLYPESDGGATVQLGPDFLLDHRNLLELKAEKKEIVNQLATVENRLRAAIGVATFGAFSDGSSYSLKTINKKAHEVSATSYRQLRFHKAKG